MTHGVGTGWERSIAAMERVTTGDLSVAAARCSIRGGSVDRHQDPLGSDPDRFRDRSHHPLDCNAMDRMAARLPAAARTAVVRACWRAGIPAASFLLVVVPFRRLCTLDLPRGRRDRGLGRIWGHRHSDRHVGVARHRQSATPSSWEATRPARLLAVARLPKRSNAGTTWVANSSSTLAAAYSFDAADLNRTVMPPDPSPSSRKCRISVSPTCARFTLLRSGSLRSKAEARTNSSSLLPK